MCPCHARTGRTGGVVRGGGPGGGGQGHGAQARRRLCQDSAVDDAAVRYALLDTTPLLCSGENIDFVHLRSGTAVPGRRSGDQVHTVTQYQCGHIRTGSRAHRQGKQAAAADALGDVRGGPDDRGDHAPRRVRCQRVDREGGPLLRGVDGPRVRVQNFARRFVCAAERHLVGLVQRDGWRQRQQRLRPRHRPLPVVRRFPGGGRRGAPAQQSAVQGHGQGRLYRQRQGRGEERVCVGV